MAWAFSGCGRCVMFLTYVRDVPDMGQGTRGTVAAVGCVMLLPCVRDVADMGHVRAVAGGSGGRHGRRGKEEKKERQGQ